VFKVEYVDKYLRGQEDDPEELDRNCFKVSEHRNELKEQHEEVSTT
jgi:hypothetical protein